MILFPVLHLRKTHHNPIHSTGAHLVGKPIPGLSPGSNLLRASAESFLFEVPGGEASHHRAVLALLCSAVVSSRVCRTGVRGKHGPTIDRSSRLSPTFSRRSCGSGRTLRCFSSQLFCISMQLPWRFWNAPARWYWRLSSLAVL